MQTQYPYWIVQSRIGRLPCPIQYKHTPVEKIFKSGKIGGTRTEEKRCFTPQATQQFAAKEERNGKTVEVLFIQAPNQYRQPCHLWRQPNWNGKK